MATSGKPLEPEARRRIERMLYAGTSRRTIAKLCQVAKRTVDKIAADMGYIIHKQPFRVNDKTPLNARKLRATTGKYWDEDYWLDDDEWESDLTIEQ